MSLAALGSRSCIRLNRTTPELETSLRMDDLTRSFIASPRSRPSG